MSQAIPRALTDYFAARGWTPAAFQREAWAAYRSGESGLIHSATGSGKSLAAWGGPLAEGIDNDRASPGLMVLWITPLRALAADTVGNLQAAASGVGLDWRVEARTGDTASSARSRQRQRPPAALVTTPESLSLMLSYRCRAAVSPPRGGDCR